MSRFSSLLAPKLDAMLEYRAACGFKQDTHARNLRGFDLYCCEHFPDASTLTREAVHGWIDSETTKGRGLHAKTTAIRQFGKYLSAIGEDAYVLPEKFAHHINRMVPYMPTDAELTALFAAIDRLPPDNAEPFLSEIAPVLFRLIYTCGLRPNEGRELLRSHVDLDTGELLITHTKGKKERLVVMSGDMLEMCRAYERRRVLFCGESPCFFPAQDGGAFPGAKLLKLLNAAWFAATVSPSNPVPRPIRVYDLRHRFASACLNRWLDNGESMMAMLPFLRAYMGHRNISDTAYYIHLLPENLVKSAGVDWTALGAMLPEVEAWPD